MRPTTDSPSSASPDKKDDTHDVIYTLRTAHQNQTQHLLLADQKANVLIGIVAVILTILFTRTGFLSSTDVATRNVFFGFVAIELIGLFFALLVITPTTIVESRFKSLDDMPNPLFFGFFTRFSQEQYVNHLTDMLTCSAKARELLMVDLYQIGKVLKRKFQLLKLAYFSTVAGFLFLFLCFGWLTYSGSSLN